MPIFLALQCFQCSTMQVKQQKMSSNKWVCVVCNHRQSVQRVHARGPLASDLRKFVQAFNMSRAPDTTRSAAGGEVAGADHPDPFLAAGSLSSAANGGDGASGRPRRTNWMEYLDPEDEGEKEEGEEGGDSEARLVTEWTQKKFGRTFPKCPLMARTPTKEDGLFKPSISKKRREIQAGDTESSSPKKFARTAMGGAGRQSKWSEYLVEEAEGCGEEGSSWSGAYEDSSLKVDSFGEFLVEEEVHPDFK